MISSQLSHSSVVPTILPFASLPVRFATQYWEAFTQAKPPGKTSKTVDMCTTNLQSWKILTSLKTLLPLHRSLRSLKLPSQLMF